MAGLFSLLFGGAGGVPKGPSGYTYPQDQNGYITAVPPEQQPPQAPAPQPGSFVQHLATAAPTSPIVQPPQQTPPQQDPSQDPITVQGDSWRPHKAGILGQIADYLLDTHFGKENVRRNMSEALEHLNSDPDEAIRRMAKVDPQEAEKLYQHVSSVKHYNAMMDREEALTSMQQISKFMPIAAGIMNRISTGPDGQPVANIDPNVWASAKHQIATIGSHYHMTPEQIDDMIPDTPDVNVAQSLAAGEFPVYRQENLATRRDEFGRLLPIRQQNADSGTTRAQAAMIGARNGSANAETNRARLEETTQKDATAARQRQQELDSKPKPMRMIMTKYGPLEVHGNEGILRRPDGTSHRYISSDGVNFVPTHQKPIKGK